MVPTWCEIVSQSAWDTPSGLSIEMRTNWFFPPPLTSTSTTSMPSEPATRSAISSMRDVISWRIATKNWASAHSTGSTLHELLYNGWREMQAATGCGLRVMGGGGPGAGCPAPARGGCECPRCRGLLKLAQYSDNQIAGRA